jgi:hypothetical protein
MKPPSSGYLSISIDSVRCSPDLFDRHSDGLRIRLAGGLGDHSLVVEDYITAGPDAQPHARASPIPALARTPGSLFGLRAMQPRGHPLSVA